jgi:hypothetical protein
MKNADRINFYLAGLRQLTEGPKGHAPVAPMGESSSDRIADGRTDGAGAERAVIGPIQMAADSPDDRLPDRPGDPFAIPDLPSSLTLHSKLPVGAQAQVAAPDQQQLHQLLQRLEGGRRRFGDPQDPSPEAARKRQRQLILGLTLAGIIIAAQATAVVWLYQRAELLLGRPLSPALLLTATAGDLNVTFRPSASSGDVAVLLRELDLQVVDGPDTGSRYVVRPEVGNDSKRDLNALRDHRDLVYSADPAY